MIMPRKEKQYHVVWEIDVYATSAKEAAQKARILQARPDTSATIYEVKEFDSKKDAVTIDLLEE